MRYRGQSFEIETPVTPDMLSGDGAALAAAFHAEHARLYGHADDTAAIQIVALRLVVSGPTGKPVLPDLPETDAIAEPIRHVPIRIDGAERDIGLYRRADLVPGHRFDGPAVVLQDDSTTVVPPGFHVRVDRFANLRITEGA